MKPNTKTPGRDERGAVLIFVAAMLVILVLSAAIAVDLGARSARGESLQNAADAAALAGVAQFVRTGDPAQGQAAALELLRQNGIDPDSDEIDIVFDYPGAGQMTVEITDNTNAPLFGSIVSGNSEVTRDSTAELEICGNSCVAELEVPPPFSEIQALATGDGYIPLPLGDRVYAVNHREDGAQVICVTKDSQICPEGYPKNTAPTGRNQDYQPQNPVIDGRIYGVTQANVGLYLDCYDTNTHNSCGSDLLWNVTEYGTGVNENNRGSGTTEVNGEIFVFLDNRTVACRNPDLSDCAAGGNHSDGTGLPPHDAAVASGANMDTVVEGNKIYGTVFFEGQAAAHWECD